MPANVALSPAAPAEAPSPGPGGTAPKAPEAHWYDASYLIRAVAATAGDQLRLRALDVVLLISAENNSREPLVSSQELTSPLTLRIRCYGGELVTHQFEGLTVARELGVTTVTRRGLLLRFGYAPGAELEAPGWYDSVRKAARIRLSYPDSHTHKMPKHHDTGGLFSYQLESESPVPASRRLLIGYFEDRSPAATERLGFLSFRSNAGALLKLLIEHDALSRGATRPRAAGPDVPPVVAIYSPAGAKRWAIPLRGAGGGSVYYAESAGVLGELPTVFGPAGRPVDRWLVQGPDAARPDDPLAPLELAALDSQLPVSPIALAKAATDHPYETPLERVILAP